MKRKVKITGLPKMSGGGAPKRTFGDQAPPVDNTVTPGKGFSDNRSTAEIKVNRSLKPTTKENATLEVGAYGGVPINQGDDGSDSQVAAAGRVAMEEALQLTISERERLKTKYGYTDKQLQDEITKNSSKLNNILSLL